MTARPFASDARTSENWRVGLFTLFACAWASAASAQSLDPAGSNVVLGAVSWIQGTLRGNVATAAAVIAVAVVGFTMLTGRMNWRHGAMVIFGCFVLFGATVIVGGIRSVAQGV